MVLLTRALEKTLFETGDVPTQSDYADVWDSNLMLQDDILDQAPDGFFYKNLRIDTLSTAAIVVNANLLQVGKNSISISGLTCDITTPGAGGLDNGTVAADSWYRLYIISNDDASLFNTLFVIDGGIMVLPANYTLSRRIGMVRTYADTTILPIIQVDNKVLYKMTWYYPRALEQGVDIADTLVNLFNYMPPVSTRAILWLQLRLVHSVANVTFEGYLSSLSPANGNTALMIATTTQVSNIQTINTFTAEIDTTASQQVYYQLNAAPDTSGGLDIFVNGYYDDSL